MKRSAHPPLSPSGHEALTLYEHFLHEQGDLTQSSIRNYVSDLRHFIAWYEIETEAAIHDSAIFTPHAITTQKLMHYQNSLQKEQGQKPASINRTVMSLKRYFGWITLQQIITHDPSLTVKFVGQEQCAPRHLDNREEQQLLHTVTEAGNLRNRVLIVPLLRAGLRASELCSLRRDQVKLDTENGLLEITGKHNTYREVPLDAIARKALEEFLPTLSPEIAFLFPSGKTSGALSERALGYIVKKYAMIAGLPDLSPHDLRHRFGYRMAETVPLHQLAQMMGLDSPNTARLYLLGTKHAKRAAQIISVEQEEQTLVSQISFDFSEHEHLSNASLPDKDPERLTGLSQTVHLDQSTNIPPLETIYIYPRSLPIQPTALIGREREVASVCELMRRRAVRLVTLTGPGGIGKTRLAIQVAEELGELFADGTYFVDLSPVSNPTLVVPTLAQRLGIRGGVKQSLLQRLKKGLQAKQVLLLLDNFEQVLDAAVQIADLLTACPQLKVIVTSREKLHVRAEQEFSVPPLALPDTTLLPDVAALAQCEAVALFLQRAQAAQHEFEVTITNASAIAEICVRLDGLPLAIELAAARTKLLTPQALLARLSPRVALLTGGARDAPARQLTLRNNIEWSYRLLDTQEQPLFRRLAVFVGGCTLESLEAVCTTLDGGAETVLDDVTSLIDKSLLRLQQQEAMEPRFMMLETIREYGLEALTACGELEVTRQAHAQYYLWLAEETAPNLLGTEEQRSLDRLEREHDNLRAVLSWLLEQGSDGQSRELTLRLGGALSQFWEIRGYVDEGRQWLERVLGESRGVKSSAQAKALIGAGRLATLQGDFDLAEARCEDGLALSQELGDHLGSANSLSFLGYAALMRSNYATARAREEKALTLFREVGNTRGSVFTLQNLISVLFFQGEYAQAQELLEESLVLSKEGGDVRGYAVSLVLLGMVLLFQGDLARAHTRLDECLSLSRERGYKWNIATSIHLLGLVTFLQGDVAAARSLVEESLVLFKEMGERGGIAQAFFSLGLISFSQGDCAEARVRMEKSLELFRELDSKWYIAGCLDGLAAVVAAQGELVRAVWCLSAAQALREAIGTPLPLLSQTMREFTIASGRTQLGEQAFTAAWTEGRTMAPAQAVAIPGETSPPSLNMTRPKLPLQKQKASHLNNLTARELEVLRLVAQGLTDAQIARQLVISPRTVNSHLVAIFGKIQVSSRSACTRYAFEHHLV